MTDSPPNQEQPYSQSPEWADVTPIPLNDGTSDDGNNNGVQPLAAIAYKPSYVEASSYLRAVMAANELSERVLRLTEDVISMNPAHYTVWLYRAKILFALDKDLTQEIAWLNKVSLKYLKNYQIWHHRQLLMSSRTAFPSLPAGEQDFLMRMFAADSKNYHVWTYRQWLVRHFDLWDSPREIADVDALLTADVRNNSAWNHRYMLRFAPREGPEANLTNSNSDSSQNEKGKLAVVDEELIDSELNYAQAKILLAPENRSAWLYARGVLRAADRSLAEWEGFARRFVIEEEVDGSEEKIVHVKSSLAVEWLADVYALQAGNSSSGTEEKESENEVQKSKDKVEEAVRMLSLLKDKYDPVRGNYWEYRIKEVRRVAVSV